MVVDEEYLSLDVVEVLGDAELFVEDESEVFVGVADWYVSDAWLRVDFLVEVDY